MPAQPPFLTPTRTAVMEPCAFAITSLMRAAAASVSRITWGRGRGSAMALSSRGGGESVPYDVIFPARDATLPHVQRQPRLVAHAARVPGRIPDHVDLDLAHPRHAGDGILHHLRQFLRRRTIRRGHRHVDGHRAVVRDVDPVDQTDLVDVGGDFWVVNRLEGRDDAVGQARLLIFRQRRGFFGRFGGRKRRRAVFYVVTHAKKTWAFVKAVARVSTSALVLYIAKEARQVAETPKRASSGM